MGKLPLLFFLILHAPVLLASLLIGPSGSISVGDVWHWTGWLLSGRPENGNEWGLVADIILTVRLPRICLAFLAGGSLTLSGAAMQAMVRNPLVSPDILGVSAGAAFGAALSLATSWLPLQPAAFCFGLLAAALSCLLAFDRHRRLSLVTLVLAGMVIGAIFTALLTLVQIWSDPFKLQSIVY
ncbi:MAG: iron ABC transporter permease, partial [Candidatus Electrothrix sp. EH2]|nr:iron ABC transporter permease [Candidatus Electrothrix sp. EH2]